MENRIVLFSNIKGGVGKTTLCALFASYLAEKGIPVFAMDADLCKMSIWHLNPMFDIIFLALSAQKVVSCMLVNGNWGGKCFR